MPPRVRIERGSGRGHIIAILRVMFEGSGIQAFPDLREFFLQQIGHQALNSIQRSDWPVRTGLSKRSFRFIVRGNSVQIINGTDYAIYVERNTGIVNEALRNTTWQVDVGRYLERRLLRDYRFGQTSRPLPQGLRRP